MRTGRGRRWYQLPGEGGGEEGGAAGRKEKAGVVDLKEEPVCVWRQGRRHRGWSYGRFQNMLL